MTLPNSFSRRQFLASVAAASTVALTSPSLLAQAPEKKTRHELCTFDKPLNFMSHDELAEFIAGFGFDGIELTLRPKGRVLPEKVEEDLPRVHDALKKRGLKITMFASGINSVESPNAQKVLETAARHGIKSYRMLWYNYDLKKPILPQLDVFQKRLEELAKLNRELGITGLYQNHAGASMVGAPIWDIYNLIKGIDPKSIALAYDIRHATVEGGMAWPISFNLVAPNVGAVYVKDCAWENKKIKNVPLGMGMVDPKFFELLKEKHFTGPVSLHIEYLDGKKDRNVFADAFKADLEKLKSWL